MIRRAVATLFALAACASVPKPEPDYGAGLRYGVECAPARDRARTGGMLPDMVLPQVVTSPTPPLPVPRALQGRTVSVVLRVDSAGYPVPGTIQITGANDRRFAGGMRAMVERTRYRPAVLEGCAVEGTARATYRF